LAWVKLEEYEENIVYKTLNFSNDTLFLDKQTIYTIAGKLVNPEKTGQKKLYYYNAVKEQSTFICKFNPVFPDEASVLIDILKNTIVAINKPFLFIFLADR